MPSSELESRLCRRNEQILGCRRRWEPAASEQKVGLGLADRFDGSAWVGQRTVVTIIIS
jgi:hypothetical protein